eukprot:6202375-Pleurochrysis_carterae.AAC.2
MTDACRRVSDLLQLTLQLTTGLPLTSCFDSSCNSLAVMHAALRVHVRAFVGLLVAFIKFLHTFGPV